MTTLKLGKKILTLLLVIGFIFISQNIFSQKKNSLKESIKRGYSVYVGNCQACHLMKGEGVDGTFPPLANSDYLMADLNRSIVQILHGKSGEITVNGVKYNLPMIGIDLSDTQIADVLNFIRNSWGNQGEEVSPRQVKKVRKQNKKI